MLLGCCVSFLVGYFSAYIAHKRYCCNTHRCDGSDERHCNRTTCSLVFGWMMDGCVLVSVCLCVCRLKSIGSHFEQCATPVKMDEKLATLIHAYGASSGVPRRWLPLTMDHKIQSVSREPLMCKGEQKANNKHRDKTQNIKSNKF